MTTHQSITELIGNTPLIRLKKISEQTGCDIYGKAEFLNPGSSVKDRTALGIVQDAEKRGTLQPGGTIVEGTAGNTGIGLTLLANALGYKSVVVMPLTQSKEKIDALEMFGADLELVQATSYDDPNHYTHVAERLANKLNDKSEHGAIWANQFGNTANRDMHYRTTGQEIWRQTDGKIDGFICAVGTGGTLGGVSACLKEHNKNIKIGVADPEGSALANYYNNGELKSEGNSITEGIGISHITPNLADAEVDFACSVSDNDALPLVFDLLAHEGLCLGGSSGINMAGAVALARELGPGHTIVTILCDYGTRYQSKLYNPVFLEKKGLPVPAWLQI
ncbi:MAG: cysteine synthase A [Pseudomonadales bacterium]|nr:MAG: cysteine synthase A [Pseudomonadales bacterium]